LFVIAINALQAFLWTLAASSGTQTCAQWVGFPGRGISPSQGHCLHRTTQTQNKHTETPMARVRFHDPIVSAGENRICPVPNGHCDRLNSEDADVHPDEKVKLSP
jgi:hypothetical protein